MRLNKLNLEIKLVLNRVTTEPVRPFELAKTSQEKGIQIFMDEYGIHHENVAAFNELVSRYHQQVADAIGVPRYLLGCKI